MMQNLGKGEKVLWTGAPGRGLRFNRRDLTRMPMGLFLVCFALFWEWNALSISRHGPGSPIGDIFPLFGLLFVFVGLYQAFGRFFWEAHVRKGSTYTLTNRRALIQTSAFGNTTRSISLADLDEVGLEERPDGSGTIILGRDVQTGFGRNTRGKEAPRFEYIADVQRVYRLLEENRTNPQGEAP